jgi:hypothetical protein
MDRGGDFDSATKIDSIINSINKSNSKSDEMLSSILSLADELDASGLDSFADKIQSLLRKRADDDDDEDDEKESDTLKMSIKELIEKLDDDGLNNAGLELGDWSVHLNKRKDED